MRLSGRPLNQRSRLPQALDVAGQEFVAIGDMSPNIAHLRFAGALGPLPCLVSLRTEVMRIVAETMWPVCIAEYHLMRERRERHYLLKLARRLLARSLPTSKLGTALFQICCPLLRALPPED